VPTGDSPPGADQKACRAGGRIKRATSAAAAAVEGLLSKRATATRAALIAYPPRAMRANQAAAYLSMSRSSFLQLVAQGTMAKPSRIGGMVMWDRLALDLAFEELSEVGQGNPNSFDSVLQGLEKN